jgi:hypothetical protein
MRLGARQRTLLALLAQNRGPSVAQDAVPSSDGRGANGGGKVGILQGAEAADRKRAGRQVEGLVHRGGADRQGEGQPGTSHLTN